MAQTLDSTMTKKIPSALQQAIYDWVENGTGSAVIKAVAGAGKTTTLLEAINRMEGTVFLGVFSKNIATEIQGKAPKRAGLMISTMHSAGFQAWRRAASRVQVNNDKCRDIFRQASAKHIEYKPFESSVLKLVGLAKNAAFGILKPIEVRQSWLDLIDHFDIEVFDEETNVDNTTLIINLARKTLEASIAMNHTSVDFDDMIFAPLYHNVKVTQYDWVLIDEAQDTNATRRALALRMLKRGGRMLPVGDDHQAIFGFTGADSDSLDLMAKSVNAIVLPLNVTFRCPKAVVAYAQQWVNHIQGHESAPEGVVSFAEVEQLINLAVPGDAILCRFNKPLIENVYKFIAAGIPAKVEGREIGTGLKNLAQRWKVKSLTALIDKLGVYLERETNKYRAKEQESKAAAVEDKVECLLVIIRRVFARDAQIANPTAAVCAEIDSIFTENGDQKVVLFSSIHKSKGREWHKVIWLQTGPSGWARKEWEQEQEVNLCYVAATRAKHELVLIDVTPEKKEKEQNA